MDSGTIMLGVFFGAWVIGAIFAAYKNWSGTFVFGGGFIFACLSLIAVSLPMNYFQADSKPKEHEVAKIVLAPSLGLSTAEFKERFNKVAEEVDAPFHINQMKVEKGNIDTFNVTFDKNHILFGTITKDGLIEGVTSISAGDGTIQSGFNMLQISHIIIRTFSPEISKEDASKIVLEMMDKNSKLPDATAHSKRVGNVEYFTSLSKQLGYWFGIQVPSNK